jgi:hypothetical protein
MFSKSIWKEIDFNFLAVKTDIKDLKLYVVHIVSPGLNENLLFFKAYSVLVVNKKLVAVGVVVVLAYKHNAGGCYGRIVGENS